LTYGPSSRSEKKQCFGYGVHNIDKLKKLRY
jgi:hypothetical protein